MKKYMTPEVNVINLDVNDILTSSEGFGAAHNTQGYGVAGGFVNSRDYYEDEEEW